MAVSIDESKVKEDLLYVGTDDGVIQVTDNAGESWTKISTFPGVPEYTYVSDILASKFDENVVFATFDNHKRDDFKPYVLKSTDKGRTWVSISSNLPENGTAHTIQQDHVNPDLLFVGTEFGVHYSIDGGQTWTQLKSGIPTIAVKDIAIQERENDLVLASFGRGFYILDDYTPLRAFNKELADSTAYIFDIKDALMYIQKRRGGYGSGSNVYIADNPPFGATFTYYIKESPKTLKQERKKREKELIKEKKPIPIPTLDELRAEENEVKPHLIFTIRDEDGNLIRKLSEGVSEGINRTTWDLRFPNTRPVSLRGGDFNPTSMGGSGMLVLPGKYSVTIDQYYRGVVTRLAGPKEFVVKSLDNTTLPAENREELVAFQLKLAELYRVISGSEEFADALMEQTRHAKQAAQRTVGTTQELMDRITGVETRLDNILWKFNGQEPKASPEENLPALPSINERLGSIVWTHYGSTSGISQTQRDQFEILKEEFPPVLEELKQIYNTDLPEIEKQLEAIGAPYTPGRIPVWTLD